MAPKKDFFFMADIDNEGHLARQRGDIREVLFGADADLLRDVKKHFAVGAKFLQVRMPFETAEQSSCRPAGTFRCPNKVCASVHVF